MMTGNNGRTAPPAAHSSETMENLALGGRPTISIRTRLILAFALIFALCSVIAIWSMYTLSEVQTKLQFLEASDNVLTEIQQARRFEKNFLLYRSNLSEAAEHASNARRVLSESRRAIQKVLGARDYRTLDGHLANYSDLLGSLSRARTQEAQTAIEQRLRAHGSKMVSFAERFVHKERESVHKMLTLARRVPFVFLGLVLVAMVLVGSFLVRQLLSTLARFMDYTRRIGEGDFSPVTPARKYRDEFSQLAMAFNRMIHELDRRHTILVESHKLRAVGTLVAGVAHELNNPLNNTMLTASMLKEDFAQLAEDEKLEMISDLIHETERSQRIVRNLLDFARESETRLQPLHLTEIIENSIKLVANQIRLHKIHLHTGLAIDLPPIHGDEQMLQQVFVNLLLNASDAVPEKGHIEVTTSLSDKEGYVAVQVRDDGPGIPEHIQQRIFEPFFTTKAREKGTGLGLSVSRGIVRKLGGTVEVDSGAERGTTFTVLLPITSVPSAL